MLSISRALLVACFVFLLGCSARVASMPDIDVYRDGFYKRAESFEQLFLLLQEQPQVVYLQWLEGKLSVKYSAADAYRVYSGRDIDKLRKVLSDIGVRFAGKESGRIFAGGFNAYKGEKVFVIDFEKEVGKGGSHGECSVALIEQPSGSCDVHLQDGWRVHYFWKEL